MAECPFCGRRCKRIGPELETRPSSTHVLLAEMTEVGFKLNSGADLGQGLNA